MDGHIIDHFERLRSTDTATRRAAATALANSEISLTPWAIALVEAAGDLDEHVRAWAADALETLGTPRITDLPPLVRLLQDSTDGEMAYWAATLLGRLGPAAFPATEVLSHTVRHSPYLPVRERAVWALGRIGPRAKSASSALRDASTKGPPRLRRLATAALESLRGMAA